MAKCSKCGNKNDLYVWTIEDDDPFGLSPEIICGKCPKPTNVFKDCKRKYSTYDDKRLGITDKKNNCDFSDDDL